VGAFELFLLQQLTGESYTYDNENIHYTIIKLMMEHSPGFRLSILSLTTDPSRFKVIVQPQSGTFDLEFLADDIPVYCEIKIWSGFHKEQLPKQAKLLEDQNATAIYLLLGKVEIVWPASLVSQETGGRGHVVGSKKLIVALDSVEGTLPLQVLEIRDVYRKAIEQLQLRASDFAD
jgi:hypothetical protein